MDTSPFDEIVTLSLREFAADTLSSEWFGKEHDWVNRYAHGYLLKHCLPRGPLREAGQVAIEVGVPQPPGYPCAATRRDLVIWSHSGLTCWDADWKPVHHPLAILEWKVHRIGRRNRDQPHEREWLRRYTAWQAGRVAYAVEIDLSRKAPTLTCSRFHAGSEDVLWLQVKHGDDQM
jgi:hypothetical protein